MSNVILTNKNYAIVFPGQGSQSLAMLNAWNEHADIVDNILQQANEALDYDIGSLISEGPEEKLNQTAVTQPAMLIAGMIAWNIWQAHCKKNEIPAPSVLAGHSLGEYTALVAAGALNFSEALRLVEYRGQCMQEAVSDGESAMAAIIGLDDAKVIEACELAGAEGIVEAVNFNAPGQVVIAGEMSAVTAAMELMKEAGARRTIVLPVSVPSHCQLMIPAAKKLDSYLESITINKPDFPVLHNVDVTLHHTASEIRSILVEQLYKPVRWVETMQKIASDGVSSVIECGPGKVLCGLQRRIDKSVNAFPLFDETSLLKLIEALDAAE